MMDALSVFCNQDNVGPKRIWASYFAGITLGTPTKITNSNWDTALSGTDTITGHEFTADTRLREFFGSDAYFRIQQISGQSGVLTDITAFNNHFTNTINTSTSLTQRTGAGELSIRNILCSSTYPDQSPLMLQRGGSAAVANDLRELYFTVTHQFPVGMAHNEAGEYKTFFEIKEGFLKQSLVTAVDNGTVRDGSSCSASDGDSGAGAFRLYLEINGSGGVNNELRVKVDDNARNGSFQPPSAYWDETGYHSTAYAGGVVFFVHKRTGVSVPLGVPVRFHIWLKKPPTPLYEDRPLGVLKVMMENLSTGDIEMLCDIHNSYEAQLCSSFNGVDNRYMVSTSYDSVSDLELKTTAIEIWNKPPISF